MENYSFYRVQVGRKTRKGGFEALTDFVCKSDLKYDFEVQQQFTNQYRGLDVKVYPVMSEIIELKNSVELEKENKNLKNEIEKLQNKKDPYRVVKTSISFRGAFYYGWGADISSACDDLREKQNEIDKLRKNLRQLIRNEIQKRYPLLEDVDMDTETRIESDYITVTAKIIKGGSIIEEKSPANE